MKHRQPLYLSAPNISSLETEYVLEALNSKWIAPNGPFNQKFESELKNHFKKEVLLTNSGTSALHLALIHLGIGENDVVLCSNFTFAASAFPIFYQKAEPVFIDVESDTWNLCPELLIQSIESCLKKNKPPKALILTHSYGVSAKIEEITRICKDYGVGLIEDAAEALGSKFNNQPLGSFSDYGILSFNGNKIVTTSSGGALIINNQGSKQDLKKLANQSKQIGLHYFEHNKIGYNYALSNVCSAIGLAQFQSIHEKVLKKRKVFDFYLEIFKKLYGNEFSYPKELKGSYSNRWLSVFNLPMGENKKIMKYLEEDNIESRFLWNPMHNQKAFKNSRIFTNGISEKLFESGIALPSGCGLTDHDLERISMRILKI